MNFLALLLGLGVERALTHFFHLREFRWLDPLFDRVLGRIRTASRAAAVIELALVAVLLTAPVGYVSLVLAGELRQIPSFVFAILVLLFSLGPRDLQEEVREYCAAAEAGIEADTRRLAHELAEHEPPADPGARSRDLERAIYVQANNRIFGVVFWFLLLGPAGPAGAWLFRVTDLLRRRAVGRDPGGPVLAAARLLHGLLAWLPARLMAAAFAIAGSFGGAVAGWRAPRGNPQPEPRAFFDRTEDLMDRVGHGASGAAQGTAGGSPGAARAERSAMALVRRTLWLIWYPVIALLTLNNWVQ
jgi:membrane protein required for beta-lactamase induction